MHDESRLKMSNDTSTLYGDKDLHLETPELLNNTIAKTKFFVFHLMQSKQMSPQIPPHLNPQTHKGFQWMTGCIPKPLY